MNMIQSLFPDLFRRISHLRPEQIPEFLLHFMPGIVFGMALTIGLAFAREILIKYLTTYTATDRKHSGVSLWILRSLMSISGWFIWLTGVYAAVQIMPYMEAIDRPAQKLYTLFIFVQLGFVATHLLKKWTEDYTRHHRKTEAARVTMVSSGSRVGHLLIWVVVLLFVLVTYGVDVTAMVAGLGVGGLAAAFAFQNILKDIFGSFSIVFDKPFVIGDFITTGEYNGTVEEIGTKTTRLRSVNGELIVISNNDILSTPLRNYGNMFERRVVFAIRVQYGTPAAQIKKIPAIIQEPVEAYPDTRFERAHLKQFTDFGLEFEAVYFITVPDFKRMMDVHEGVNLAIYSRFEKENIRFAVPIQNMLSTLEDIEARREEEYRSTKAMTKAKPKAKAKPRKK